MPFRARVAAGGGAFLGVGRLGSSLDGKKLGVDRPHQSTVRTSTQTTPRGQDESAFVRRLASRYSLVCLSGPSLCPDQNRLRPCLVPQKFCKTFQISCHIESLDVYMEY